MAECFPGATVTSVEGATFQGSCKVKLGPIALVYNGSGTFVEKDETAHRFVVDAKGKDKRGNGTAGAKVTLDDGARRLRGHRRRRCYTDLAITGKPAQFGRGVMQDVSDKLLGQFVACLEQRLAFGRRRPRGVRPAPEARPRQPGAIRPGPGGHARPDGGAAAPVAADDALDLGATVLPILARTYWKQALACLGPVALVVWLSSADEVTGCPVTPSPPEPRAPAARAWPVEERRAVGR